MKSVSVRASLRALLVCSAIVIPCALLVAHSQSSRAADEPASPVNAGAATKLTLAKGNRVVLIGNNLPERMQYNGNNFETLLHAQFPSLELAVRNLGYNGDELSIKMRSQDFKNHGHNLADHKPDVLIAFFGFNESFKGEAGLAKFENDLDKSLTEWTTTKYNGNAAPQVVLVSPIAHENLKNANLPDGAANNKNIALYTAAMAKLAAKHKTVFVDLYKPTLEGMAQSKEPWTINGIHLNKAGDAAVANLLLTALFGESKAIDKARFDKLQAEVNEKNLQFFYDYRAVNGFYIYGGRKAPFGIMNFPEEFKKLRKMIENRDQRIWAVAQGKDVPPTIDDSNTGENPKIPTNYKGKIDLTTPEDEMAKMTLPKGYKVNLFASEREFPELEKPVQMAFDSKGRLWVVCMPSYPQYLPGVPVNDRVIILEDTDGDGKADKRTVFADGLHVPTGIELIPGGAYVANQPNLLLLKDTNGDDKADTREVVLGGFDSCDSHHSIHAFTWDPGGALYFGEGTFNQSSVETINGPQRLANAGFWRYEPKTEKFDVFISYSFANPWGHVFDRWGQNLVADASGGANYFGTAFSGQVDFPTKHGGMKQFLKMQYRPTGGCELVSSKHFPDDVQGNFLLNNCIGFQGTAQYKVKEVESGFEATPVDPLIRCSDPSYRPVDLEFGPDGALYICDWYNPLVGHMQHSIRDPNRDKQRGRIWRISYPERPLVKPAKIAGEPIPALLELLRSYEDRTRYRVRTELRGREAKDVIAATKEWLSKLDKKDADYERLRLEALWLHQSMNVIDEALLKDVLRSPEYRARAAATRVLCYWRDQVKDPLALLGPQVNDDHPRVRLEAVRALSFFNTQAALDLAAESLLKDQDDYLKYTLKETNSTLEKRLKAAKK